MEIPNLNSKVKITDKTGVDLIAIYTPTNRYHATGSAFFIVPDNYGNKWVGTWAMCDIIKWEYVN